MRSQPPTASKSNLSARSVIASTLLGTHPPALEGRLLVALAGEFGIAEGTARVALTRMVDKGELMNVDGTYALCGHLLERQLRQDTSLRSSEGEWSGEWRQVVVVGAANPGWRATRRVSLGALKFAEWREGVWLRPDNLDSGRLPDEPAWTADDLRWGRAVFDSDAMSLAATLWDLDGWADTARSLVRAMDDTSRRLLDDADQALVAGFELSAAVLRHLVADPVLPAVLWPPAWPSGELRDAYVIFDQEFRAHLRRFFRALD